MVDDNTALLTIVIPTYNRKELLLKAVKSVTNQQVQRLIIHIFDNCSTDGTDKLVRELMDVHPNIRYTRRDSNLGSLANYSDAIRSVKTPFFMSLADDDWLLEGGIKNLLSTILDDESLGAVISQTIHQCENGKHLRINPGDEWEYKRYIPEEFIPLWFEKGHFEWSSIIFRHQALEAAGVPDITTDLVWDVDLQLQIFFRYPVKLIKYKSATFLNHPEQSSRIVTLSKLVGQLVMLQKANDFTNSSPLKFNILVMIFTKNWLNRASYEVAYHTSILFFLRSILKICSKGFKIQMLYYYIFRCLYFKLSILKHKSKLVLCRQPIS